MRILIIDSDEETTDQYKELLSQYNECGFADYSYQGIEMFTDHIKKFTWYDVVIIDYEQNIIAKKTFASEIEFRDGRRRADVREEIEQILFLKEGENGDDYEIIVGMQLTEQQLKQNRRRRR